jgi:transglutaminase-like putative cysteine protease
MRFAVIHTTRYRYVRPVLLGPHLFRLRPRSDGTQQVLDFRVRVQPRPKGWSEGLDLDGNAVARAWFDGVTESLTVVSTFGLETLRTNPFDFLLEPAADALPAAADAARDAALAVYRVRVEPDPAVTDFAVALCGEAQRQTVPFLTLLCRRIAERSRPTVRLEGDPQPPAYTLRERTGACRDLAVLFIDACRAVGLAARFVSGYFGGATAVDRRYLHAWAEVYLPGAGWRGFDPLQGLAVADRHIAVAAAAHPRDAAPIDGSLRSGDITASLDVDVQIDGGATDSGSGQRQHQSA